MIPPAKPLPSAVCVTSGVKSTRSGLYCERSTLPVSKYVLTRCVPASGCCVKKLPEWPNPRRITWWPLRRYGSIAVAPCGGRGEVQLAADQQRLDARRPHASVGALVGRCRPRVGELAAAPDERGCGVAEVRLHVVAAGGEVPAGDLVVGPSERRVLAPDEGLREEEVAGERLQPEPARVALLRREPRADRHRTVERRGSPGSSP